MEENIQVSGEKIRCKDKEFLSGLMEEHIKGFFRIIRKMVMGN